MFIPDDELRKKADIPPFLYQVPCWYCQQEIVDYPVITINNMPRQVLHPACALLIAQEVLKDIAEMVPTPRETELSAMAKAFRAAREGKSIEE